MGPALRRALDYVNRELEQLDRRRAELTALRDGMVEEIRTNAEPPARRDTLLDVVAEIVRSANAEMNFEAVRAAVAKRGRKADPLTLRKAMATAAARGMILRARHGYYTGLPDASAPQAHPPRNISRVTDISRRPHRLEVIERVPGGHLCPRCRVTKSDRLDFLSFDCRR